MPDSGTAMEFAKGTFSHAIHDVLHLGEMSIISGIRTALLLGAFLVAFYKRKQKFWLDCEHFGSLLYGICLVLFPHTSLSFWTVGNLDAMHLLLARLIGMVIVCSALTWLMSRTTYDNNVPTSHLFHNSLLCSLIFVIQLNYFSQYYAGKVKIFNTQFVWFQMLAVILSACGNFYHLAKSTSYGGYSRLNDKASKHLMIEFFLIFLAGINVLAFPESVLGHERHSFFHLSTHKMDTLHTYLVRILGVYAIISSFGLIDATFYQYKEDKQAVVIPRILNLIVSMGYLILAYFGIISHKLPGFLHFAVFSKILFVGTVLLANNALAFYHIAKQGRSRTLFSKSR